jgi:hypothetical protein
MIIDFAALWQRLPKAHYPGWRRTRWDNRREILHLLCGALWHLELASQMTNRDFSASKIEGILNPNPEQNPLAPWEPWTLNPHFPAPHDVTVRTEERMLTMRYVFCAPFPAYLPVHLQTVLLADGALRLAGAYELLPSPKPTTLGDVDNFGDILTSDGSLNRKIDRSDPLKDKRVCLLLVIALRDSFMHGENAPDKKPRFEFRNKWFAGYFVSPNHDVPYSPAIIARACQKVWEEILEFFSQPPDNRYF